MDVLLVEDDNRQASLIEKALAGGDALRVTRAASANRALSMLRRRPFELVLLDYSLPDRNGLEVLHDIRSRDDRLPVVFLTSNDSAEICARAMKGGAQDYVVKKRDYLSSLPELVGGFEEDRPSVPLYVIPSIAGHSLAVRKLAEAVLRAARSDATVLLEGETGTGKELAAREIHRASHRANAPFVTINCPAIPSDVFESEVFGHRRGAFTGADADHAGLFRAAGSGIVFLDEVEAIPLALQAKLLRVLQTGELRAVGSTTVLQSRARVIAASNESLERLVRSGRFRRDLYYRLNVLRVDVPPLRDRREDVPDLVRRFVERHNERHGTRFCSPSARTLAAATRYSWPGNVRELENLIERTLALSDGDCIDESILLEEIRQDPATAKTFLIQALERNHWNRRRTAEELRISRVTLWRRMRAAGIEDA